MKEHFFIVYDFSDDRQRARFVKILESYGIRVQYSIFEFLLTKAMKIELFSKMKKGKFLKSSRGSAVMVIPIPKDYEPKIERYGDTVDLLGKPGIFSI